jgi:hypothetical protein
MAPQPEEDKSDRPGGGGASREQERRPSKAWGIIIFGLIGATTATFAVGTSPPCYAYTSSLKFPEDLINDDNLNVWQSACFSVSVGFASTCGLLVAICSAVGQFSIKRSSFIVATLQ